MVRLTEDNEWCIFDHKRKRRAKYACPRCDVGVCEACAEELEGECPECEPPRLEAIGDG